jgi:formylglycine-generating enzyme required for sulfatase activity
VVIPQASNVTFSQRTDGSKLVDISYTLDGGTSSVALGVSLDGGTTFSSVTTLTGAVGAAVSAGTAKQIVWNAGTDQPGAGYPNVKMRVTALLDGAGGTFAPIPGGTYQMGNLIGDSDIPDAAPVGVTLSPYYMAVKDTTKAQWDAVRTWAAANGYTDLAEGAGKASNHPVQTISWYDAVKWANAASEREGLAPCYKVSGAVYRTGSSDAVTCNWGANGYRLPTEAEWEVAARGGLSGKRFPWGDTISQAQANYYAFDSDAYDLSGAVNNSHPTYGTGEMPYTSPVGSFAANGYGLYDMAGNVFQWCWDWYGTLYAGGTDPRGDGAGSSRVLRGGSWNCAAFIARSANRDNMTPSSANYGTGFRLARERSSGSGSGTQSVGGVVDTTPPVVSVPGAVSVSATSGSGASVTLSGASATDNLGGTPTLTYAPASGSTFPVGATTVTVTAKDSFGNTSTGTYTVTVSMIPPAILTQPASSTVTAGSSAAFSVVATGGSLGYQWRKGGSAISGGTLATLAIASAQTLDAGSYDVVVTNAGGSLTSNAATLTVNVPPTIVTHPAGAAVNPGAGVTFSVVANGTAPLAYQWRKNGVVIAGGTAASHTVASAQATDAANYDVVVANAAGSVTSNTATLSLNAAPRITVQPSSLAANPGAVVAFSVTAEGTAPLTYQWRKGGQPLAGGTGAAHVIAAAQPSDAGSYDVVVTNVAGSATSAAAVLTLNSAPTILTQPVGGAVNPGATVTLNVTASGTAPLQYQWRKNGVAISGATAGTWKISAAQAADAGNYDVVVSNVAGSATSAVATVELNSGPTILTQPSAFWANPGAAATFNVVAEGTAVLAYQWRKNGVAIAGGTSASYTVAAAQSTDTGNYDVVVTNGVRSVTSSAAALTLNTAPGITAQPVGGALNPGASKILSVTATGTAPLGYQWRLNGSAIAGGTASAYTLSNASETNAGSYDVVVTNVVGSVFSNTAVVTLNAPPSLLMQPDSLAVNPGKAASFSVQAGGTAPLTYQWRKNGVPVSGATAGTYSIASAQSTHAANYDVVVSNVAGSVTSAFATLTLNTPVTITAQPVGVAVNPGAPAAFSVAASGTAPLAYQWSRNGTAIAGATDATYTVAATQSVDAGSYSVVVSNVVGSMPSNAALLSLNQAPVLTLQPSDGAVNPGGSLSFSVGATGTAPLTYQWRKGGVNIAGATASAYTVLNAQASDAGAYDAVVSNVAGSATSSAATLTLHTPVSITTHPGSRDVVLSSGTTFSVTAAGTAPLRYQWRRNGTAIAGATAAGYSIGAAQNKDAGDYDVEVTNSTGSVWSSVAVLRVLTPPGITTQPVGGAVNPGGARTLSVVASGTAPLAYQWRCNGVDIPGATAAAYTVADAQASDAGAYTVAVRNAAGSATSTPAAVTVNVPVTITVQPEGASVASGTPVTLSVAATGTVPLTYQWRKNGVAIAGATGATYTIGSVKAANVGGYDVLVGNPVGSVSSDVAAVALAPLPPAPQPTPVTFTGQLVGMGLNPGADVTLSVPFTGVGTFSYQWRKDGLPLAGATAATYTITGAQAGDAGSYALVVTNETGPYTSNSATFTLNTPVSIQTHPVAAQVNPGATVTLSVAASGTAPLTYKWRKDGQVLAGATSATYVLASTKAANVGNYDVVVSNMVGSETSEAALVALNTGVSITTQPVSATVNPGGTATFNVAATGTAPLSYRWMRGGVDIGGATGGTLSVGNAQAGDAGSYTVAVSNVVGSVTSTAASLALNLPVTIVVPPAGVDLNPGAPGTLRVSAVGTAPLTYQWSCNGEAIPGATLATYAILAASALDAGAYTVQVTNVVGSVTSAPAQVRLNSAPTISVQPSSVSVNAGGTVSLSVLAEGTATLNYQWRFNGSAIAGATKATYTLTNAQVAKAGNYEVVVGNVAGNVTSQTAAVTLNEGPKIGSQPQGQAVNAGAPVMFSVVATGTAPLAYQWRLDGEAVPGATGANLTLSAVQAADAGRYDVLVTNIAGSVLSSVAQLTLNTPPSILTQPVSVMANPGGAVRFGVVASGTEVLAYQWRKDGSLLAGAQNATYALASVQGGDAGVYDVVVRNVAGSVTSTGGTLGLNAPVSITTQPADVTLNPGASGTLTVVATGTAPLLYQWYRNGRAVSGATAATCPLTAVQAADAGAYTVEVTNVVGSVGSSAATVSVNVAATLLTQPQGASVAVGSAVSLGVVAAGTAPLGYQWRRNGAALTGATGSTYALAAAQISDGGVYDVVVSNVVGSVVSAQATLTVVEPPTLTAQPQPLTVLSGQAASFHVTAVGTAPLRYQWRRDGEAIAGATAPTYTVGSALPVHGGSYEVAVSNSAGTAVSVAALLKVHAPVSILTQPADLAVNLGADAVLTVGAAGTGPLTYQWRKAGVPVAGGTQQSLVVSPSQFADAGSYDVRVGNVAGSVTSKAAVLTVRDPQSMTPPPAEVSVAAWESTTLEVVMTGAGPFTYQWRLNGVPVKGATGPAYTIAQATSRSAGVYDVVVGTPLGSLSSKGTTVTVTGLVSGQPTVLVHPKNSTVKPYAPSSVSATVASEGPFSFQWRLNGVPVGGTGGSGRKSGGAPQTITYGLGTTVDKHQGLYQLVVTGGNGVAVESRPGAVLLTISFGETRLLLKGWTTELGTFLDDTNQGVDASTGVRYGFVDLPSNVPRTDTLLVAVNTVGTPSYTWHYRAVNGVITPIPSHANQAYPKLELSSPDVPKKKGAYVLTIRTSSPVSARAVYFNVMTFVASAGSAQPGAAPVFVRQPGSLTVPEGGAADFGVELDGLVARYAWWKRDVSGVVGVLPWARSAPWLTMDAAVAGDGGAYWVEALDFFGRSVRSREAELRIVPAGD